MRVASLLDITTIDLIMQRSDAISASVMLLETYPAPYKTRRHRNDERAWFGIAFVRFADGRTEDLDTACNS